MNIRAFLLAGIAAAAAAAHGANTGSCFSAAKALSGSQSVTLTPEYDKEMYEGYDDSGSGVYYLKKSLKRGTAHTIWISGGNAADIDLDVDINWDAYGDSETIPGASFSIDEYNDGAVKAATITAADWDEEDPGTVTFYVILSGDAGMKTTVSYSSGIVSFIQDGDESKPVTLTMKDSSQSKSSNLVEGEYWFRAKLTAGRLYKFTTAKGTDDSPLSISIDGGEYTFPVPGFTDEANESVFFEPEATATYKFYVSGDGSQAFKLSYQSIPKLAVAKHAIAGEMAASNEYAVAVALGALHASYDYWDEIIDTSLVKVALTKGERWYFETTGAAVPSELRVYDPSGAMLASNDGIGNGSLDCRVAITVPSSGTYYVGVCDTSLDVGAEPKSTSVTLSARNCADLDPADEFDGGDDVYTGASQIYAACGAPGDNIYEVGTSHGPHRLDAADWYDYYALPCRSGVTYGLRAEFADEEDASTLQLGATVFYVEKGKKVTVATTGSLTPIGSSSEASPLEFTAKKNLTYYIGVYVADGLGLDYPWYTLRTMASKSDGTALGLLQVKTKGADATWYLNAEKLNYKNGATLNLPVGSSQKVVFNAVSGFATPAAQTETVAADLKVVTGIYNDSYDSYTKKVNKKDKKVSDDNAEGAVSISGSPTTLSAKRTLWTNDPRDMFLFKASAGVYYNFRLVDTTLDGTGDAQFVITKGLDDAVVAATDNVSKRLFDAGEHYLTVSHADSANPVDTSYALEYSAFNAGTVKFSAAKYTAKESAAYATLTLKRSAKQGRLRVNYATMQGSSTNAVENAMPGSEYYPTNGVVEWANGDMKDKTIRVRLIPDLVAAHESGKSFSVKIWPMDADDIEEDEYPAQITLSDATVTIAEATAANPGTVSVTAYGDDDTAIANVKKPAFSVTAGDDAVLTLSRTGGADGRVAVKVSAAKGKKDTARAGTDFEAASDVIVWEDGDAEDKEFIVQTLESADLAATRTFTVSLAVQTSGEYKGCAKAALSAKSAAVTIRNSDLSKSLSAVQKEAKSAGATLSAKGTWYQDSEGNFRSTDAKSASVTFAVKGPGVFVVHPDTDGCGELSCRVGSGEKVYADGGIMALAVPSGKQNIVFSYSDDEAAGHPSFLPLDEEGGEFYRWVPFTEFAAYEPFSKSVYQPGALTNLAWTVPAELMDIPLYYRVRHGLSAKAVTEVLGWTESAAIEIPADLTADPSKTHYWALDFAIGPDKYVADPSVLTWNAGGQTWSFSTAAAGAATTDLALVDAYGNDYYDDEGVVMMETIRLVQGVAAKFEIGPAGSQTETVSVSSRVYSGALPPGLTLDGRAGQGVVSGVPTKAGSYTAVLQTATGTAKKPVWASTITLRFEVEPIASGAGTFFGTLAEDGHAVDRSAPAVGSISLTSTAAGKLSAKVTIAGLSYTFSGNGFAEVVSAEDDEDGVTRTLRAVLTCKKTYSKVAYTSVMEVTMLDAGVAECSQGPAATVELTMNVPDAAQKTVTEDVVYTADLYRSNVADADCLAALDAFKGYYTLALVPEGIAEDEGLPLGNGFLGVKVGAKGAVTITGRRADGQAVSASAKAAVVGDPSDPSACVLRVPFATSTSTACLGGVLELVWGEDVPYIDSSASEVTWGRDGAGSTEDASGFLFGVVPVGGWYNTVADLQRYYLDYDFTLDGAPVSLTSNAVSLGSKTGDSVSAITYTLNRATGIASGTLTSYSEYTGKNVAKCPHYGMLLFTRDSSAPLSPDVWAAGFFLRTATKAWKESVPFNILAEEVDRDWSEAEIPSGDGE